MLAWRGVIMLQKAETTWGLILAAVLGALVGVAKGNFVLGKTARRNIKRMEAIPSPRPWNVFTSKFYVLILLMIGLGVGLRSLAAAEVLPWALVGGIYLGIGLALLVASRLYLLPPRPPLPTRTDHIPERDDGRTGLLVTNLGTPDAPTGGAVRRYLREFLSDRRVVEVPAIFWAPLLNGIILPIRGARSARAYRKVWDEETGSPLMHYTRAITDGIRERLDDTWVVEMGMRYGSPSLEDAIRKLHESGCRRIVALPLYPQYSNTTTGTTQARISELISAMRDQPAVSFVPPFPDDPGYVSALAARVREACADGPPDHYVFSFHGLPEDYVKRGDPYVEHCARTSWALATELGLERHQWEMIFQSRFGPQPWLQPYLDEYVPGLTDRYKRVLVTTPGFAADCLETIEEVGMELRDDFEEAGGEELIVVPALNDSPPWLDALARMVQETGASTPS